MCVRETKGREWSDAKIKTHVSCEFSNVEVISDLNESSFVVC